MSELEHYNLRATETQKRPGLRPSLTVPLAGAGLVQRFSANDCSTGFSACLVRSAMMPLSLDICCT